MKVNRQKSPWGSCSRKTTNKILNSKIPRTEKGNGVMEANMKL